MAEATIKVKLIPDTSGISAGLSGVPAGLTPGGGGGLSEQKKLAGMFTIPITDVLSGILKGINKVAEASPQLAATLDLFKKGMFMFLRPIGDFFAQLLRPLALLMLRFFGYWAANVAKLGFLAGTAETIKEKPGEAIKAGLVLTGVTLGGMLLTKGIMAALASALGIGSLTTASAGISILGIPAAIVIGTILFGAAFGAAVGGKGGAIVGAISAATGLALAVGAGVTSTGGLVLIPAAVAIMSVLGFKALKQQINQIMESDTIKRFKDTFGIIVDVFEKRKGIKSIQEGGLPDFSKGTTDATDGQKELREIMAETSMNIDQQTSALYNAEGELIAYYGAELAVAEGNLALGATANAATPLIADFGSAIKQTANEMRGFVEWYGKLPLNMKQRMGGDVAAQVWAGRNISNPRRGGGGFSEMSQVYAYGKDQGINNIGKLYEQAYKKGGVPTTTGGT